MSKTLNIYALRIDGNTQARVSINQDAVADYAAAMADDNLLPEPIVFFDGAEYWLADGFHRYHAHLKNGKAAIIVEVRNGTQRDAVLFSLQANTSHGLRPNNDDKRKAVETMLADPEWSELSDRAIARHCGCSHPWVASLRNPEKAAAKLPSTGNVTTPNKGDSTPATTKPAPATGNVTTASKAQAEAAQIAQDAHGDDADPIALLEEAEKRITALQQELFAAEADDQKAETLKWKRVADVAQRRQDELMDTVNAREKELQRFANWMRRIGAALGEDDNSKLPAKVEALARASKG